MIVLLCSLLVGPPALAALLLFVVILSLLWHRFIAVPLDGMPIPEDERYVTIHGTENGIYPMFVWNSVKFLSQKAGIPMPRVSVMFETSSKIALAFVNELPNGHVLISGPVLMADPVASFTALAHEVSHVALRHTARTRRIALVARTLLEMAVMIPIFAIWTVLFSPFISMSPISVLMYLVIPVALGAAHLFLLDDLLRLRKVHEFAADEYAAILMGNYPLMAQGLFSIAQMVRGPEGLERESDTHPSMGDRIRRLYRRHREIEVLRTENPPSDRS
jgi:Zn-dependent protease with chaperone function